MYMDEKPHMKATETINADELPEEFEHLGLSAKLYHDTVRNPDENTSNRHAVVVGGTAIIIEEAEE